jgi:hypothetical protein
LIKVLINIALFILLLEPAYVFPQFVDFGKNKVMYSNFDWYILNTEHFNLYYYKEAKELAEKGAYLAEESYKILQQKYNYSLIDSIPLIIYTSPQHFKETNTTPDFIPEGVGGFFEFIKGRVVLPYDGSIGNLKHVMRHELVHVFMTSKVINNLKTHGTIIERLPPLWFTEGLAEYWSTEWDTQAEMVLKDAVLNGYIQGLSNWEDFYGTYLMYKLGQKACEYIGKTFGEDKILQLMDNFWMYDSFESVMKYTLGKDYEEFDKGFLYWLKKLYYPDLKTKDDPSQISLSVPFDGFAYKSTYSDIDNQKNIYFIGNRSGYTSIYRYNLDNKKNPELILEGETTEQFEEFHFFRTGLDVSSKGMLAFVTRTGSSDMLHIYDVKKDKNLNDYSFKDIVGIGSPSWNKDGRYITFAGIEFSGKGDIYLFDIQKEKLTRLTNDYYDDRDAVISPDGKFIVFSSDRSASGKNNKYDLFIYNLETNEIKNLTDDNNVNFAPAFSPDGKKIVYTSNDGGINNIWLINLPEDISSYNNTTAKQLTHFTTGAFDPKFCDSAKIIFTSFEKGSMGIKILENVLKKEDTIKDVSKFEFTSRDTGWTMPKISGELRKNTLKYNKRYSFDIATTAISTDPVFGTNAGGLLSFSDLLGNDRYNFLLYSNSDGTSEFWRSLNIAISRISLEQRLNYAYGVFHLSGKRYDLTQSDFSYYERIFGTYASFSYPFSFFRRIETTVSLASSEKDLDFNDIRRSILLSNKISYIKDNTLWFITGPIDGEALNITLGYESDIENSDENYYSFLFDYRKYFRLAKFSSLALRGQFFINEGKNPRRYFIGGSWSLRGWSLFSIRGTKLWQTNAELRFPLLDLLYIRFPFGMVWGFPAIRGALFFDAGNSWDNRDNYVETRGSIGAGLRINIFGVLVLRYDFGKRIEKNFTKLQSDLFQQVFFGWDF